MLLQLTRNCNVVLVLMSALSVPFCATAQTSKGDIQQRLEAKYALTTATVDWTDVATAGAVVVLKKDNLLLIDVNGGRLVNNTYKDEKLTQSLIDRVGGKHIPGAPSPSKTFLAGKKIWVTSIDVKASGVVFEVFTDAIVNVRYRAAVTFPFPKGTMPSPQEIEKTVGEVFGVVPSDAPAAAPTQPAPSGRPSAAPAPAPVQRDPAPPPIAPPPPPPNDPAPPPIAPPPPPPVGATSKSVKLGMTSDEVISVLGQPTAKVDHGVKGLLLVYKDVKITLVNGKVSDVN